MKKAIIAGFLFVVLFISAGCLFFLKPGVKLTSVSTNVYVPPAVVMKKKFEAGGSDVNIVSFEEYKKIASSSNKVQNFMSTCIHDGWGAFPVVRLDYYSIIETEEKGKQIFSAEKDIPFPEKSRSIFPSDRDYFLKDGKIHFPAKHFSSSLLAWALWAIFLFVGFLFCLPAKQESTASQQAGGVCKED